MCVECESRSGYFRFFCSSHGLHMLSASRARRNLLYIGRDACWPSAAFASLRNVFVWLQRHRRELICNVALKVTSVMTDVVRTGMQHGVCPWPYMISFASLHQFGISFALSLRYCTEFMASYILPHSFCCQARVALSYITRSRPDVVYGLQWQSVLHLRVRAMRH